MSAQPEEWLPGQESRFSACWRHEGALSRMEYEQALDYAEACTECVVEYREPEVPDREYDLMSIGPSIEDVEAPLLTQASWATPSQPEQDDEEPEPEEEPEPRQYLACALCGSEVYNEALHVCAASSMLEEAGIRAPEVAEELGQKVAAAAAQLDAEGAKAKPEPSPVEDQALFSEEGLRPDPVANLRKRFTEPPFTVLNRKGGEWAERDRRWKALGIQSELGRKDDLLKLGPMNTESWNNGQFASFNSTSIFSPTLAELAIAWYSAPDSLILDPFCGGSVRGVVAGVLGRHYTGLELRPEQVASNELQGAAMIEAGHLSPDYHPNWVVGDAAELGQLLQPATQQYDMVFSCPPYAHLEEYSDDPRDLSSMQYPAFLHAYQQIISAAVGRLHNDRFAVWVIGEVREKGGHSCLGLVADTIKAFQAAGADLYNDHIMLNPIGSVALRAPKWFNTTRKAGRVHEYVLVFVKGDGRRAATHAMAGSEPL